MRQFGLIVSLFLLSGCATLPEDRLAERDPLEAFNRGMWKVNTTLDKVAVKPVTTVYRTVTPRPARRGISRIFLNLAEPWSAINNLLQGKPRRAARNIGRFLINSTIGVGGLADHATGLGLAPATEDLGQTFASWGVTGGPYLVLPLLGPSTLRDGVGATAYFFADPYHATVRASVSDEATRYGLTAIEVIDLRSDLLDSGADSFLATSLDPYAAARSAFLQRRKIQIRDRENDPEATENAEILIDEPDPPIADSDASQVESNAEPPKNDNMPPQ